MSGSYYAAYNCATDSRIQFLTRLERLQIASMSMSLEKEAYCNYVLTRLNPLPHFLDADGLRRIRKFNPLACLTDSIPTQNTSATRTDKAKADSGNRTYMLLSVIWSH